jgi:hypothetical protein
LFVDEETEAKREKVIYLPEVTLPRRDSSPSEKLVIGELNQRRNQEVGRAIWK